MLEKEIKILDINTNKVTKKLEKLGAKKTFEGYIHDVYYDFPNNGEKNKMELNGRIFRVRKKGDIHMYTIKRKRTISEGGEKGLKVADEGEREITDVESFKKVLEKYGMIATREKKKYRISYNLNGVEFDIDDYFYEEDRKIIPPLLEIEAKSKDEIDIFIQKLNLTENRQVDWGSKKLFKHYGVEYNWL